MTGFSTDLKMIVVWVDEKTKKQSKNQDFRNKTRKAL